MQASLSNNIAIQEPNSLATGLQLQLKFNGDYLDSSGNSRNGTATDTSFVTGKINQASSLLKTGYIDITNSVFSANLFSVSLWINGNTGANSYVNQIFGNGNFVINRQGSGIRLAAGINYGNTSDLDMSENTWYHIVIIRDIANSLFSVYINNSSQSLLNVRYDNISNNQNIMIGSASNYRGFIIDDVRWYNRVLTTDEITQLYNSNNGQEDNFAISYKPLSLSVDMVRTE